MTQPDAELRGELVRLVRGQAERARTLDQLATLNELRAHCYRTLIRASVDGALPRGADIQAIADLIAGAVWSRFVQGEEMTDRHAAAVVDAVLPRGG